MSQLTVQVETPSPITRKLTIKVPRDRVAQRFERGLAEVQRTARLKGFRPGNAPLSVIKQYYGADVRHRVYHNLIDETFQEAVREQKLQAIGAPKIEAPEHQHGQGDHDHGIQEDKDFTYTATVEVMPELEMKGYTGLTLKRENVEIKDSEVDGVVKNLMDAQAELTPVGGGLVMADGSTSSRAIVKGDHVDMTFAGGVVTESGLDKRPGMDGTRVIEIGSDSLIPGFEDSIIGMKRGETKTFRIPFPKDYFEADLSGKEAEFTVTANEVKEKKMPELNDEFAKNLGRESVADLKKNIRDRLLLDRTREVDRKLQNDLIGQIVEKNPFDVPKALVEAQTRALAQDWAQQLKQQGFKEDMIQEAIRSELESLHKRAEGQVRASLVLETIAKKEKIEPTADELQTELAANAKEMNVEIDKLTEFYAKNPGRKEDFEFRLRQDKTVKFLMDKSKIKS